MYCPDGDRSRDVDCLRLAGVSGSDWRKVASFGRVDKASRRLAHLGIRHPIHAAIEKVVNESGREAESQQRRNPRRLPQPGYERTEYPIAIVRSTLAVRFDFENRQEDDGHCNQDAEDSPWPRVQRVEYSANEAVIGNRLTNRHLGCESCRENPMLGGPDDEK